MVSKGRQKIDVKLIEKKEARLACFSKRRSGLFKKARELSILSGAKIGAAVFSPAGRLSVSDALALDAVTGSQTLEEGSKLSKETERAGGNGTPFWWSTLEVGAMGCEELLQFERALMLEYGQNNQGPPENSEEGLMLQGEQQSPDEGTLIDAVDDMDMFDEQWLQWFDEWMMGHH